VNELNRMIFVPVIMAIAIASMTATIPVITMPQIAKADTDCSQTYLTQQEKYNCGYNRGYLDAQRDWNLHRFPPGSGGDNSCPHAKEHTLKYCNGYQIGYTTSRNARLNQGPNLSTNYTSPTRTKFLKYENSTYGIKMQYPSDWRVEGASNSSIVALFYPQGDNASKVTVQIENLGNSFTPDQYLNGVMRGDVANYKDFPDIKFTDSTTSNIVLAGHPGFFLNGTFRGSHFRCIRQVY
jgi:hypothetical protein